MKEDGIMSINLFTNKAGGFQANTGRGDCGYTVKKSADPVKAILAAIKAAPKQVPVEDDFSDVLG
ncbi:hypothetical protein D3C80_2085090 [compost metagenome]